MVMEFAPLSAPLTRMLQSLVVFSAIISFTLGWMIGTIAFVLLFCTRLYFIPIIYAAFWFFFDFDISSRGGRRFNFVRNLSIWKYYCDYFPITLHKTVELDPAKNYIMCYHPHGVLSLGASGAFVMQGASFSQLFPGITPHNLTLKFNFHWPFHRDYLLSLGLCDVSKESINYICSEKGNGNAAIIVIGGAAESLEAYPEAATLVLKDRKGFVKMALRNGAHLVPVYAFGENDLFNQVTYPWLRKLQEYVRKWSGIAPVMIYGRGIFQNSFGFLPFRVPVNVVVGAPIEVVKTENPSQQDIDGLHSRYIEQLTKLYNDHKELYSRTPHVELQIV